MTRDLDWILFSCVLDLPWWGCVIAAIALTHITLVSVTVFLHRHQAHRAVESALERDLVTLNHADQVKLTAALAKSRALHTAYSMRRELIALWDRSVASKEQLVRRLQDWCQRAEASGIVSLAEFSQPLRSYK